MPALMSAQGGLSLSLARQSPPVASETLKSCLPGFQVEYSRSYPGLKTVYNIHTVKCRVKVTRRPNPAEAFSKQMFSAFSACAPRMWTTRRCHLLGCQKAGLVLCVCYG